MVVVMMVHQRGIAATTRLLLHSNARTRLVGAGAGLWLAKPATATTLPAMIVWVVVM